MKIETKYNIGDQLFFISGFKVAYGEIIKININININVLYEHISIEYELQVGQYIMKHQIPESDLFKTKEKLITELSNKEVLVYKNINTVVTQRIQRRRENGL